MSVIYRNKKGTIVIYRSKEFGYHVVMGSYCASNCNCKYRKRCPYKESFKRHNFSVRIHDFFQYKLHIKLPYSRIHFSKHRREYSGTKKCPFGTTVETGCYKCKNCCGTDECCHLLCSIPAKDRHTYNDEFWRYQCKEYNPYE